MLGALFLCPISGDLPAKRFKFLFLRMAVTTKA